MGITSLLDSSKRMPEGANTLCYAGARGGGRQGDRPAKAIIEYNLKDARDILRKLFGLESTVANILGHELGHVDYMHELSWGKGINTVGPGYQDASEARSIGWEDLTRQGQYRRRHQPE